MDAPLCYYLALHSKRPVKMVMDYIQELMAGNPRHPVSVTLKSGLKNDGRIWARQATVVFNSGSSGAFKPGVFIRGADHVCGDYLIPHASIQSYMVYTNTVPCGHMRSPGKPQAIFAVEAHTDMIAKEIGMDPYQFRLLNCLKDGDANPVGEKLEGIRAADTLKRAAEAADWGKPKQGPYFGRGMALSDLPQGTGQSNAKVAMNDEGKASLIMSLWDTGTGAHTVLRQIVAEALTIPVEDVSITVQDTDAVPFDSGSGGSRVTYTAGQAAFGAAQDLRQKLISMAARFHGFSEDQITLESGRFLVDGDDLHVRADAPCCSEGCRAIYRADGWGDGVHIQPYRDNSLLCPDCRGRGRPGDRSSGCKEDNQRPRCGDYSESDGPSRTDRGWPDDGYRIRHDGRGCR